VSNRKILVTGSSRGIGRTVAQAFAAAGDTVAIHHRDSADLAAEVLESLPGYWTGRENNNNLWT
jgi:3-oxoacyl-[acyl-carrier protein] reductase